MLCNYIQRLMQVLIHSELLSTHIIVLFLVSNQNVPEEMSISHNNNKLNISSLYVCIAIKHIIVLFVETPRKFITAVINLCGVSTNKTIISEI